MNSTATDDGADLLEAIQSSSFSSSSSGGGGGDGRQGLFDRFASFLSPFTDLIPIDFHGPSSKTKKPSVSCTAAVKKRAAASKKKKPEAVDAKALRALAKQFLPFLCRALQLLPSALRRGPKSSPDGGKGDVQAASELLNVYRLSLDCLACIGPCLAGKPYATHLQRGRYICCLEAWGRYDEAESEGWILLEGLRDVLLDSVTLPKKEKNAASECFLPDPKLISSDDAEVTTLALEIIISLSGCAFKSKSTNGATYERILSLVEQVRPWLGFLNTETQRKYHSLLVDTLFRCSLFLLENYSSFEGEIVQRFCTMMLRESLNSSSERIPVIARKVCLSVDLRWDVGNSIILGVLKIILEAMSCSSKVDEMKSINKHLETVSYIAGRICSSNKDICQQVSKLLYEPGDDIPQVPSPITSILTLYATGLNLKHSSIHDKESLTVACNSVDACPTILLVHNEECLLKINDKLGLLAEYFLIDNDSKGSMCNIDAKQLSDESSIFLKSDTCRQTHGKISWVSYLDALDFLCKPLVEHANEAWKYLFSGQKHISDFDSLNHVCEALHHFCDLILAASRMATITEEDRERLYDSHGTFLQVAVLAFKISLLTSENCQKSLFTINWVISSSWIEPQELKFFISAIYNTGASFYNAGQFDKASIALELCCKIVWAHVKLLSCAQSDKSKGTSVNNTSRDALKDAIRDAFLRISKIVDVLQKCGAKNINELTVRTLSILTDAEDMFHDTSGTLALVKQWVKIACKDLEDIEVVDDAPVLYQLLTGYSSTWPKRTISKILEQELIAYSCFENRKSNRCQKMQLKVIDILLNVVYTGKEYYLKKSQVLIRKGRLLRACGVEDLNKCIEYLSEAISLLYNMADDCSQDRASINHQLAVTYCLYALCAQEVNQDCKVILHNIQCALHIWSKMDIHASTDILFGCEICNVIPLLCSLLDLLSLKGFMKLQLEICNLMIRFCMAKNVPLEKCCSILWSCGRLHHSLCTSPISEDFILNVSGQHSVNANHIDYWIACIEDNPASLCMFLQKLLLSDSILSESNMQSFPRPFNATISIEEIKKTAQSLLLDVPLNGHSAYMASHLYYDLAKRLFNCGKLFEALSYAREALRLRRKILRRKFNISIEHQPAKSESGTSTKNSHVHIELVRSDITEIWLSGSQSGSLEDSSLTAWNVLRCYLESTLQVANFHETAGNGVEAELLLRTGKDISCSQGLPVLGIGFSVLLGKLYRRKQLWDLAENELNSAKKLLVENEMLISCQHCTLYFHVNIDMEFGDLSRNLFAKSLQASSTRSLTHALSLYKSALTKLNNAEMSVSMKSIRKVESGAQLVGSDNTKGNRGFCKSTKVVKNSKSPACNICNQRTEMASRGLLKDPGLHFQSRPRKTRSSNRSVNVKVANGSQLDSGCDMHTYKALNGIPEADVKRNEDWLLNEGKCWQCHIVHVIESGFMQNILYINWEFHSSRVVLMLLLKIAKCLGASAKHGEHEVHEVFDQCVSVLLNENSLQSCSGVLDLQLINLIVEESFGDFFCMERAEILYYMSWYCLNNIISEHTRAICCNLSKIQMSTIVPWLLRSFILSRELPLLSQKVSRLLSSILVLSSVDGQISLPSESKASLSLHHWAAYFHQASIGTYLHCQYLSCLLDKSIKANSSEGSRLSDIADKFTEASKFLRFAPENLDDLEEYVINFYQSLPVVPTICISLLGGDYASLIGEMLLLPSSFPAWMLLSRFSSSGQPNTMLLPVDHIQEDVQLEDLNFSKSFTDEETASVKNWQCPWAYSVVDQVVPSFRLLLEANFLSLSATTFGSDDLHMKYVKWWSRRTMLENFLNMTLKRMEVSWLGPWGCLLLGEQSCLKNREIVIQEVIDCLKSKCKFEPNEMLVAAILNGANSSAEAEACIQQLLLYKGYFGLGACCGEERLRAFSVASQIEFGIISETIHSLVEKAFSEDKQIVNREPVIITLDSNVQMLPWENLPMLKNQEVYRMPSVGIILSTLLGNCDLHKADTTSASPFPVVDPFNTYYLLNPSGDLSGTQAEFEQWFRDKNWKGKAGNIPTTEELVFGLQNHDMFLYFGHGSGTQYMSPSEIQKLDKCAATLLMGCSSGSLTQNGPYAPQGAPLSYLFAGSPAVIANLWDVTDKDIDRFGKAIITSWLQEESVSVDKCDKCIQLVQQFGLMSIDADGTKKARSYRGSSKRPTKGRKEAHKSSEGACGGCCRKRIVSYMSQARNSCRLPLLIGASPVCYGLPTLIWKKHK